MVTFNPINFNDAQYLEMQTEDYLENAEEILTDWLNVVGNLRVEKYVSRTRDNEEMMMDLINPGLVEVKVLNNPTRAWAFIKEFPPHLKQYIKNQYTKGQGLLTVRKRWQLLMMIVANELRKQNCPAFMGESIVIYNFHFPVKHSDPDNMTIRFLNNGLRDTNFIKDDDFDHLFTLIRGCHDQNNPGMEMTLLNRNDFIKYPEMFLE